MVLISGEAGAGKSALVGAFLDRLRPDVTAVIGGCDDLLAPPSLGPFHDMAADNADLAVMLPYLACYMGHADLRGTQYYLRLTADAYPEVMAKAQIRFGYVIPAPAQDES